MSTFVPSLLDLQTTKADDSAVVHNTGNEIVNGTKTFTSPIVGDITGNAATVTTNANLTGDVTSVGNVTTISSVNSNVGTFGDGTHVARITANAKGQVTAVSEVLITGAAPVGPAGGDLSGTYPNPTVSQINGVALGSTTATSGNLLIASGTQWVSTALSGDGALTSGGALTISKIGGKAISLANSFTTSGNFTVTQTYTGNTNITFPTSGTLATTAGSVPSITGSANQVLVNGTTGTPITGTAITLTLPQFIGTTNSPTFQSLTLSGSGSGLNLTNNTITFGGIGPINWLGLDSGSGSVFYGRILNTIVSNAAGAATSTTTISVQNGSGTLTAYMDWDGSTELIHAFKPLSLTTPLALSSGGTNANLTASNGGIFYSTASAAAILSGTATAGQILRSGATGAPSWSTATYPATAGTSGNILTSDGTNWNSSSAAGIGSPLTTKGDIYVYSTTNTRLAVGTVNGQILQVSSGAATGLAWSTPTYPSASGTAGKILRADGTNNLYSTATFADTYTASNLLYSNGSNTVTGLATANNGLLVTGATGVPSILAGPGTTGNILQSNAAAAPSFSTATYPSVATSSGTIMRANGTNWVASTSTFADTYSVSTILYASSANTVAGLTTANNGLLVTSNTGVPSILAGPGATGRILQSNSAAAPSWSTPTYPSASGTAGKILRSDGTNNVYSTATFADTYSASTILYSNGANTVTGLATDNSSVLVTTSAGVPVQSGSMTNGQMIIGSTGATPQVGSITVSGNLSRTLGAGTFALSLTGPASMTYTSNSGTSATLNAFAGIIPINVALFTFTLAATASVGDVFEIVGRGSGGWVLNLNAGQTIFGTGFATTSGGSITSTDRYNSIRFVCVVANTGFVVSSMMGNPTAA